MKPVIDWLTRYSRVAEELLSVLDAALGGYSDEKLAAVEAAIDTRQELLDELSMLQISKSEQTDYAPFLEAIKRMEAEIESAIKKMMAELDAERQTVQDQRSELNRLKMANRSYAGTMQSTEGYFIDRKK